MSYLSGSCPFLSTTKEQRQPPPVPFLCSGDLEEVKKTIRHTKIDSSYDSPDPRPRCMWALFRFPRERNSSDAKPTDSPRGAQLLLQTVRVYIGAATKGNLYIFENLIQSQKIIKFGLNTQ
ncbi:unnamed protein product [Boreogadus saida]